MAGVVRRMIYPSVLDEFATIAAVAAGKNLARLGDGELKIACGAGYVREPKNPKLSAEVLRVLVKPHQNCLVGVPTMNPTGPKIDNWTRHCERFRTIMNREIQYYSAFVSRPDSAPWIATKDYALSVQALWSGKRVTVLCDADMVMLDTVRLAAKTATHIKCPTHEAYAVIDDLEMAIIESAPEFVVLSAGPTATCLANRLARHSIHAIDLGSAGKSLGALLQG